MALNFRQQEVIVMAPPPAASGKNITSQIEVL
jgi:hypothetical protein